MFVNLECGLFEFVITIVLLLIIWMIAPAISRRRSKKNLKRLQALEDKRKWETFKYIGEQEAKRNAAKQASLKK